MRVRHLTENTEELLQTIVKTMQDKKGEEIISLNLKKIHTSVTDYFVICHANSRTQVASIADHILDQVQINLSQKPFNKEGFENSEWILLDYIDIVVHVFLDSTRSFYQIEKLWADGIKVKYED